MAFPLAQDDVRSGKVIEWVRVERGEVLKVSGVIDQDVASLLRKALKQEGIDNVTIGGVINDTGAAQAAGAYLYQNCYMGLIVGLGFNIAAIETNKNMLIITEAAAFNKVEQIQTLYDIRLDQRSNNPGKHILGSVDI
jgi:hexokinase